MKRKWMTICGLSILVLWAYGAVASEGKRAFEIADYYRTTFVGSPEVSPDGSLVAFSVSRYELEEGERWSEIWMMDSDGTRLRQMTHGRHRDSSPKFSRDGKNLLFVSNRSESRQLHLIPVDGGEAKKLTEFTMGLSGPVYSPDGRYIAVQSDVYPECGIDSDCNDKLSKDRGDGKLNVHVADELLYRHWTSWRDEAYTHILLVDAGSGEVVKDLTPGSWDSPTFSLGGSRGFDFSPDGKELCFVSNHDADQASSTNADLWTVSLDGEIGESSAQNLTGGNGGWDGAPLYSPDGRWIAFLSQKMPGYESDLYRIGLYDREAGTTKYLTDGTVFDNWIDEITWTKDSAGLYFQGEVEGRNPIFHIDLATAKIEKLHAHSYIGGWEVASDDRFIYTRRSIGEPSEIFRVPMQGGTPERLTHFNRELENEVDIRPAEEIWVQGEGDYKIQVFLVKPHGFDPDKKYPIILNVHGGPQGWWADSYRGDWQVYPGKGYVLAFANPTGSSSFGQDYVDAIGCDYGGRVYRDLMKVTDSLEKLPYVDGERMGAMGWSYGGYMMMWFEGQTDRFKAIVAMMGLYDLESFYGATEELWFPEKDLCGSPWTSEEYKRWSPSEYVENFKTPALVITGELDYRVPYTQSLAFFTALQKKQVPSRLVVFPDAGHWPAWHEMAFYYNAHLDWFHTWLGGEPAPYDLKEMARNRTFKTDEEEEQD